MRNRLRVCLIVGSFVAGSLGTFVAADAAHAALPTCDRFTQVNRGDGTEYHIPSAGSGSGDYNCLLRQGNRGEGVFVLQETLNMCYASGLLKDGIYGNATKNAVARVQREKLGITPDGIYGPQTKSRMKKALYRAGNGPLLRCEA